MRRVAVTGVGAVSALGLGADTLWIGVQAGRCGIGPITGVALDRLSIRIAAEAPGYDADAHFERKKLAQLDRTSQFALVAAREAMGAARPEIADPARAGVVFGASIGHETTDDSYRTFYGEGSNRLPPLTIPRIMPSGAASQISMAFGLRGASFSTASACASATHAIGLAFQMVRAGMLDVAVTGGSDAPLCVGVLKGWEALRVLSPDGCRPFSRDRNGLVLGEGAGVLVLEQWDRAVARGAPMVGEMVGFGMSADAADLMAPSPDGMAAAMRAALDDARLDAGAVGYVNAHGTGTRLNDRSEASALRAVLGSSVGRVPVSSSKSMLGHTLCAAGALESIVTLLALRDGVLPPTIGWHEADPECDLDCVPNEARRATTEVALSNSFAFGGLNAVLAMRRVGPKSDGGPACVC